jgi:hypothetical protein
MSFKDIKSSGENKKYSQKFIQCNVCNSSYHPKNKARHESSSKHINHRNNVKTNHIEFLLKTKNTLNTLNSLIDDAIKNNGIQNNDVQNNDIQKNDVQNNNINNIQITSKLNNCYVLKYNDIKNWEKDLFEN